jgi:hypothetical protein
MSFESRDYLRHERRANLRLRDIEVARRSPPLEVLLTTTSHDGTTESGCCQPDVLHLARLFEREETGKEN